MQIYDTLEAEFEPAKSLALDIVKWSSVVVLSTSPRRHSKLISTKCPKEHKRNKKNKVNVANAVENIKYEWILSQLVVSFYF